MSQTNRKPRIALMGEFSAGKSTLSNLLLGQRPLPEKVTATRLSPVWMSYGTEAPYRIDMHGQQEPVSLSHLEGIDVEATRVIRLFFEADILEVCDLIDFPGISDPNMSSDVWQRMLCEVDAVLWCTHATQAWRQSEAAVWDTMPEAVRERSVLLVTRFDKLTTERDRARVLARLGKETDGLFAATFPISLTAALAAGEDFDAFARSGGHAFLEHLVPMIDGLNDMVAGMDSTVFETASQEAPAAAPEATPAPAPAAAPEATPEPPAVAEPAPVAETPAIEDPAAPAAPEVAATPAPDAAADGARVVPRRVRAKGGAQTQRPRRPAAAGTTVAMDAAPAATRTAAPAADTDLRAIFKAEEDDDGDDGDMRESAA